MPISTCLKNTSKSYRYGWTWVPTSPACGRTRYCSMPRPDHNIEKCYTYMTSRLDYCNGLLYGLPTNLVAKLQSILNTAARLVTKPRKYEHITPVMINLHWLPIQYRIQFKLLLLIYKSLHGLTPSYLTDKWSLRPNKGLRYDNQLLLNVTVSTLRLKFYRDRAFSVSGPTLWNARPKNIRLCATLAAFKTNLKTYLFKKAYKV